SASQNPVRKRGDVGLHEQYYNGCRGPLFIRGSFAHLMPWLRLFEEIHLGGPALLNGLGCFRLRTEPVPFLDRDLARVGSLVATAANTLRLNDVTPWLTDAETPPEATEIGSELMAELINRAHRPRPYTVFNIPKPDGTSRAVERLHPRDLIVQHRLLELL